MPRPQVIMDLRSAARAHTATALRVLAGIMRQEKAPAAARVTAATELLNRGWGRPAQVIAGDPDNPVLLQAIQRTIVDPQLGNDDAPLLEHKASE